MHGRYYTYTYLHPVSSEVREEVSIYDKLCDETERLLESDTAQHPHHVRALPLRHLLHHVNLRKEVTSLTSPGSV